jgi:hypothetical protein
LKDWTADASDELRSAGDFAVALAVCGYLVAAAIGLPLFEDGSFYFFTIVTEHAAVVPNLRVSAVLPQLPAVMAFWLGADLVLGRFIFSAAYMSIPLAALVGCWLLLRRRLPALFLLVLPSFLALQLNFSGVSELLSGLYLTWPLLLAMLLLPKRRWVMVLAIAWGPLLLLLHPMTFIFSVGLGLVAWLLSRESGDWVASVAVKERRVWRRIGLWLVANGLVRGRLDGLRSQRLRARAAQPLKCVGLSVWRDRCTTPVDRDAGLRDAALLLGVASPPAVIPSVSSAAAALVASVAHRCLGQR